MADLRTERARLDTPRDVRRHLVRRPTMGPDTFGRFAERFARYMGTARFLLWMTAFVIIWVVFNLTPDRFDKYPFIFLTLMLSLQASYAAPLILLAQNRQEARDRVIAEQNRQEDRDRVIAEQDRQVAAQSKADMEFLAREMASLRMALGEVATRDYVRSELRALLAELEERRDGSDEADEQTDSEGPGSTT